MNTLTMIVVGMTVCSTAFGGANGDKDAVSSAVESVQRPDRPERTDDLESYAFGDFKEGQAYANQKQYDKAIDAFNRAAAKGLRIYELFVFRGVAYLETKQYQHAKQDADQAIAFRPDMMLGYELLAGVHYARGHSDAAIRELTNGLTKLEGNEKAKLQKARGITLLKLGRRADAIRDLTGALELGDTSASPYYQRGKAYSELGQYELALRDFSEALKIQPSHEPSLRSRGWVYDCLGELEKSAEDLSQLLSQSPKDAWAHSMRAGVRLQAGDVKGGLVDAIYALEHESRDPWIFRVAANAYYLNGNVTAALEVNKQGLAVKDSDNRHVLQFQRGGLLLMSDHEKEAVQLYMKAEDAAFKRSDRLSLQEAIAELKEEVQLHPRITEAANAILKRLERRLAQTKAPSEPNPNQCQRLRKRDAGAKGNGLNQH